MCRVLRGQFKMLFAFLVIILFEPLLARPQYYCNFPCPCTYPATNPWEKECGNPGSTGSNGGNCGGNTGAGGGTGAADSNYGGSYFQNPCPNRYIPFNVILKCECDKKDQTQPPSTQPPQPDQPPQTTTPPPSSTPPPKTTTTAPTTTAESTRDADGNRRSNFEYESGRRSNSDWESGRPSPESSPKRSKLFTSLFSLPGAVADSLLSGEITL